MHDLVGRERECALLRAALASATDGRGGWVLVSGEAGIGKTRLLEQVLRTSTGARVLWSATRASEQHVPYRPWLPVLRALDQDGTGPLARLRAGQGGGPADRAELHDEVVALLERTAQSQPLVVVLEDLHWADPDSLVLLDTAGVTLRTHPVLLLASSRTGPGDGSRPGLHLPLAPLDEEQVARLADVLGAPAALRPGLHVRSRGNPLFVVELVQQALAPGAPRAGPVGLPASLAASVQERLRAAGPAAADLALAAAVLGQHVQADRLLALAGSGRGTAAEVLRAELGRLVDSQLLLPQPGAQLHYAFPHALVREAVLAAAPPLRRGTLAASAADLLRAQGAAPGLVAALLEQAGTDGTAAPEEVADGLAAAAAAAERACAWEQAVGLRERARSWAEAADDRSAAQARLAQADAVAAAGAAAHARPHYLAAAERARRCGAADVLALAALGLSGGLGGAEVPLHDDEQVALLDEALAALPPGPLRAHVRARRSVALTHLAPPAERASQAERALQEAGSDDRAAVTALSALADARSGPADVALRRSVGAQMVQRGSRAGSPEHEMLGLRVRLVAELEQADLVAARSSVAAHAALAERFGQARYRWYAPLWRATLALAAGDLETADAAHAQAEVFGARSGSTNADMLTVSQRAVRHVLTHDADALLALIQPVLLDHPEICGPRVAHAWALRAAGQVEAARAELDRLLRDELPQLPEDAEWLPTLALLSDAVVRLGAVDLAGPLCEALAPHAGLLVVDGIVDGLLGHAGRAVGALHLLLGRVDEGEVLLEEALRVEQAAALPLLAADTRDVWGLALLRLGRDVARARDLREQARAWRAAAGLLTPSVSELDDVALLVRQDDGAWEYARGGRQAVLPAARGLELLRVLLSRPGEELRAVDLDGRTVQEQDLGPALDARAARAYRERAEELLEQVESARRSGDAELAARLRHERDALQRALDEALGRGGRPRPQGSSAERARTAVTKALRAGVRRLAEVDPLVGEHLASAVRTGAWCSYRPDPAVRLVWRLG